MRTSRLIRNRLLGATRRLMNPVARWRKQRAAPVVALASVQRRVELLLAAMYGRPFRVVATGAASAADTGAVVLPAMLLGEAGAVQRYRLLAIEQGARILRGTRGAAPEDLLERDVYLLIEAAAIDADIVRRTPSLARAVAELRREELARRPGLHRLTGHQRDVELLLRGLLASAAAETLPELPRTLDATESAAAAREIAARLREKMTSRIAYRPIAHVGLWDDVVMTSRPQMAWQALADFELQKSSIAESEDGKAGKTQTSDGTSEIDAPDDAGEAQSATDDRETSSASASAGGQSNDAADGEDGGPDASSLESETTAVTRGGIQYPEWIARYARLEPRYVTVHVTAAPERDDAWAREALHAHAGLLRQVRDRFALLRAQRLRLRAQRNGDALDLDACVAAHVDMRMKRVPSDRLYQTTRMTRPSLAIAILVDVSGSTSTALPDGRTVLDVERLSLLLASEALGALGDPFAILAFSGVGRHDVRVMTVKDFAERDPLTLHRRISALEAKGNTRLGAAVRHATAALHAQPADRRVLLILSDGRPNDVDRYQGGDGIDDSRQAILAAHSGGVHSFCLTVDADEAEYLPHLFGAGRYWLVADVAALPRAVVRLIDTLLTG
jgi:nitric oxide reductase NorD protein